MELSLKSSYSSKHPTVSYYRMLQLHDLKNKHIQLIYETHTFWQKSDTLAFIQKHYPPPPPNI